MMVWLAPVAQRIEQQPSNLSVTGSIPVGGTKLSRDLARSIAAYGLGRDLHHRQ